MSHGREQAQVDPSELRLPAGHAWNRLPAIGAVIGVIGLAASAGLGIRDPQQFFFSWLVAFTFFLSIALGGMFFVLTHFLTKASWSVVVRRLAEQAMGTLPLFILLFIPVIFGMHELFHWTHTEAVAEDHLLQLKQPFLNKNFFLVRAAIYFAIWTLVALWFKRTSVRQDRTGDVPSTLRMIRFSALSLIAFALTVSFAAIDWIMSLDPHWYSTMFGVYYFAGCLVGIFSFMVVVMTRLEKSGAFGGTVTVEHFHDMGKLLFGFTVFWAYIAFSQYFLIWYGNIPEETVFYLHRMEGAWKSVTGILLVGHFAVPFLFMMNRVVKRRAGLLTAGALWLLLMHLIDLYWLIMPTLHKHDVHLSLLDLTTLMGIGGLFVAVFGWQLRRHALIPVRDPRLADSLAFENV